MGWFFKDKPDNRPPSDFDKAVARSLEAEPARWVISEDSKHLCHDSGICVDVWHFWISRPYLNDCDMPDAGEKLLKAAVMKWIELRILAPKEPA